MIRSVLEYACAIWHTSLAKGQSDKLESIQKRALRTMSFSISLIPKNCPRSAWTPSSRDVKTHARNCSKTCRSQPKNSTTSCRISKTHHTACGPVSATPDQKQKLTDIETASSPLLCPIGSNSYICFALLRQQWTENLSKSGQPKTIISSICV